MYLRLGFALQHNRDSSSSSHLATLMTSSSSSSITGHRHSVYSVPTRCWCGNNLKTFASRTKENPFRRFHRCVIALGSLSNSVQEKLARQEASIGKLKEELAQTLLKMNQVNVTQLEETDNTNQTGVAGHRIHSPRFTVNIGVAFAVLGVAAWFSYKLT
ncbi:unnamed protein product [Eruca vesicaria subsp. sativa]|uniref:Uncharacterized protein n=1 Tax=Eruca vesicaria subsp. sativa TaxID=29727 RepID=A0ABC8L6R9_ERUVS|nr:unnamed protein product [Eruca vesicaria subsp. sativa]